MKQTQAQEIIEILENHKTTVDNKDREKFYESTTALLSICERFYSKKSAFQNDIEYVRGELTLMRLMMSDQGQIGMDLAKLKVYYKNLIETIIIEISNLGFPSSNDIKIDKSVNVNVHQNQQQNQTIEFSFILEAIKDELTGKQLKELKEIINAETEPKKAKEKLGQKIKEFGLDVTSGVLASIISNPTIWGMIR